MVTSNPPDEASSATTCVTCDYELAGLFDARNKVTCPECGRRYGKAQLRTLHEEKVYFGAPAVLLACFPLLVIAARLIAISGLLFIPAPLVIACVFVWCWVCVGVFIFQNSRRKLGAFSAVSGIMVGFIAALFITAFAAALTLAMWN